MRHKLRRDKAEIARSAVHDPGIMYPLRKRRPNQDLGLVGGKTELPDELKSLTEVPDGEPRSVERNHKRGTNTDHL